MRLTAFAPSVESLENYAEMLRRLSADGDHVDVIAAFPLRLPLAETLGRDLNIRSVAASVNGTEDTKVRAAYVELARNLKEADPDIVFHCDATASAAGRLTANLRQAGFRGIIIGGQANLVATGGSERNADRLLCFGPRGLARLPSQHQPSAQVAGLPRLDRLRDLPVSQGSYAVFLAHQSPEPAIVTASLGAFEQQSRLPVIVRDHPDHPGLYTYRSQLPVPAVLSGARGWSTTEYLQHCTLVIATDATALVDALYLGKPVALLPNSGLTAFDGYPGIAEGFGPAAILEAARRVVLQPDAVAGFLEQVVGGRRHDHVDGVLGALDRLLGSGPLRRVGDRRTTSIAVRDRSEELPRLVSRVELAGLIPVGGRAAELGVAKGAFSDELLAARDDFHLYSIDRWGGDRGHDSEEFDAARTLLGRHGGRCTIVRKSFDEALADFEPASLDLIYIDGYAHDGQEGGRTLDAWWSRLKVGGIFAGHDYHPDWKPTVDAVDAFCRKRGLAINVTSGDYFPSWFIMKMRD